VECGKAVDLLGAVSAQDEGDEGGFFGRELLLLFFLAQVGVDADEVLTLVFAQVEDLEGAVVFAGGFQLALYTDHALARGVDGELAQVGHDPFAAQSFCDICRGARPTEEISDQVSWPGGTCDDSFDQFIWFLSVVSSLVYIFGLIARKIVPDVAGGLAQLRVVHIRPQEPWIVSTGIVGSGPPSLIVPMAVFVLFH
jgi:hypothetical protein